MILGEADDKSINAAVKIAGPSTSEEFRVFGHGNPKGIQYKEQVLNADKVAHLIRNSPQYVGGNQKVILYACDTGKNKNGFAQQLADNLWVMVEAPNRKLFPTIKGEFIIADKISWSKNTYIRGSWVQYKPKKYL